MADQQRTSRNQSPSNPPSPQNTDTTINGSLPILSPTSTSPEAFASFDWEAFEKRYERSLNNADARETEILKEFKALTEYFNLWAAASSAHDNERAVKRLQTRERYVTLAEERMAQKQHHYAEVMKAFQSAMALLKSDTN